jgi:hypothetical protein
MLEGGGDPRARRLAARLEAVRKKKRPAIAILRASRPRMVVASLPVDQPRPGAWRRGLGTHRPPTRLAEAGIGGFRAAYPLCQEASSEECRWEKGVFSCPSLLAPTWALLALGEHESRAGVWALCVPFRAQRKRDSLTYQATRQISEEVGGYTLLVREASRAAVKTPVRPSKDGDGGRSSPTLRSFAATRQATLVPGCQNPKRERMGCQGCQPSGREDRRQVRWKGQVTLFSCNVNPKNLRQLPEFFQETETVISQWTAKRSLAEKKSNLLLQHTKGKTPAVRDNSELVNSKRFARRAFWSRA